MQAVQKITTLEMRQAQPVPKSSGIPIPGSIPQLMQKQVNFFVDAWKEHGDIYEFDSGLLSAIVVNHPDYAQHILRDNWRNYSEDVEMYDSICTFIGTNVLAIENIAEKPYQMMQGQFDYHYLAEISDLMVGAIDECFDEWDVYAESGEAFDISFALHKMTGILVQRGMLHHMIDDETANIFALAYETISQVMSRVLYQLAENRDIAEKLAHSVDEALDGNLPTFDDLHQLGYSHQVIEETMRMYPPVYFVARQAIDRDIIGGHRIEAGQLVFVMTSLIHQHPDFWDKPEFFAPERFAGNSAKFRHPLAYMPFGAGQGSCITKDFAMMQGTLILSQLIQGYRVYPVIAKKPETALSVEDAVWVTITKR